MVATCVRVLLAVMSVPALAQEAASLRVSVNGADGIFGFSSNEPALNFSLASLDGVAGGGAIALAPGIYTLTADDVSGMGLTVTDVVCSGAESDVDRAARSVRLEIGPGDLVSCAFSVRTAARQAEELIGGFLVARGNLLLPSLPPSSDRVARLKGTISVDNSPKPLMDALPKVAEGKAVPVAVSVAAIDRLRGNEARRTWDVWLRGSFALFGERPRGQINAATLGADYAINDDLLVGAFVQGDSLFKVGDTVGGALTGNGWLAGGYATARVTDEVYLDVLAGTGRSLGLVDMPGTGEGQFDTQAWLMSASVLGQWSADGWTLTPQARLSYVQESTAPYLDSAGNMVGAQLMEMAQVAVGPGVSYRLETGEKLVVDTGVRFDATMNGLGVGAPVGIDSVSGKVEGNLQLTLPEGARWKTTVGYGGLGTDSRLINVSGTLSVPLR